VDTSLACLRASACENMPRLGPIGANRRVATRYASLACALLLAASALRGWVAAFVPGLTPLHLADRRSTSSKIGQQAMLSSTSRNQRWLQELQDAGFEADDEMYSSFFETSAKSGDVSDAEHWFDQARDQDPSFRPSSEAVSSLVTSLLDGRISPQTVFEAESWLKMAADMRIDVSDDAIESFIKAALDVNRMVLASWGADIAGSLGAKLTERSLYLLVNGAAEANDFDALDRWVDTLVEISGRSSSSVTISLRLLSSAVDVGAVRHILKRALAAGVEPTEWMLNSLMERASRAGDLQLVEEWYEYSQELGIPASMIAFKNIIAVAVGGKDMEAAERWYNLAVSEGAEVDVNIFNELIHGEAQRKNLAGAEKWYGEMQRFEISPDAWTFNGLVDAAAERADLGAAESWFLRAQQEGYDDAYIHIGVVKAAAKANNLKGAETWFASIPEEADSRAQIMAYANMIYAAMRVAQVKRAEELFRQMVQKGLSPNREVLQHLRWALGIRTLSQLCLELGVDRFAIMSRKDSEDPFFHEGQTFTGSIRTYSEPKSWGFLNVNAPGLEVFQKGVFFHHKDVEFEDSKLQENTPVRFQIATDMVTGRLQATKVELLEKQLDREETRKAGKRLPEGRGEWRWAPKSARSYGSD